MSGPIEDLFKDEKYCHSQIIEARQIFGNKTTTREQYTAMEKTLGLGYLYCPESLKELFHSTLLEATNRQTFFELYFWKNK